MSKSGGQRTLIIGGAGYIGTELINVLRTRPNHQIVVVDLCWFGKPPSEGIELHTMDAWDLESDDIAGFDCIVFLGGLSNDPMAEYSTRLNLLYNATLPTYLGFEAREAGVRRFIFASSCSVYGSSGNRLMVETDQPHPAYAYGIAKLQAEQGLLTLANESFSVYCLRKGTVCGTSARQRLDILLNTMIKDAITIGKVTVRDPTEWRPVISVSDAVSVYSHIVLNQDFPPGIYNVAEGNYTVEQLGRTVVEACARRGLAVELQIGSSNSPRSYKADLSKLRYSVQNLNWQTPDEIANDLLRHMLGKGSDFFSNPRCYNIQTFKQLFPSEGKTFAAVAKQERGPLHLFKAPAL